ncbi:acyl-CoA dehydrogenase family protein [Nocardioides sp. AE5]|uniref:acyl-CoA dehydrogenase family protein n=1 Tax=Nocardioides sp. AE5 TaxID=2962573 RepID=UPI002882A963|nr:acyl-CoA dehydrogenase family protein [Nocardioides sp. AE5]MDT0201609.1 acyl-CoA dehydrogenase family protein [Nocardioides sp. AE5]
MHFGLSEDQQELAELIRGLLARRGDSMAVRAAIEGDDGFDRALWTTLCEQVGVAALAVPEEYDGAGATLFESAVVLEELGQALSPVPMLASTLAVTALRLHGTEEQRTGLLPRIAAGEIATVVLDPDTVLDAPYAEIVLALVGEGAETRVEQVEAPVTGLVGVDQTIGLGAVDAPVAPQGPLRDVAAALATALQVGAAQRGLDMTVSYAKERVQFGRAIGSFQALKHRMSDMLVLLETSRSVSWAASAAAAAYLEEPGQEQAALLAERSAVARSWCTDALAKVASETVQLHGGIAITWEHDAHLVFKRAHALGQLFGQPHEHRARIAL